MAGQLKLLRSTQKVYQHMGIYPPQSNQNQLQFNWRNILMLFSLIQIFIFSLAFLIFEAETIVDAGSSFYAVNSLLCCTIYYLMKMWKMPKIRKLIENFEKFIEESKLV